MIAAAAGLFLYLSHVGVLPPLESWMVLIGWVVVFVFGALAAASLGSTIQAAVGKAWARFLRKRRYKQARDAFTVDIPFLNEKERQIWALAREKAEALRGRSRRRLRQHPDRQGLRALHPRARADLLPGRRADDGRRACLGGHQRAARRLPLLSRSGATAGAAPRSTPGGSPPGFSAGGYLNHSTTRRRLMASRQPAETLDFSPQGSSFVQVPGSIWVRFRTNHPPLCQLHGIVSLCQRKQGG